MRRAAQAASAASLAFIVILFLRVQARFWNGCFLIANNNTWRDFRVYREIGSGLLPLQGPSSSIGGHHGFLAYWAFGFWTWAFPGYHALQVLCGLNLAACLVLSGLIAARLASKSAALLGLGCYLCGMTALMTVYPNHIIFMPFGTAMAFYGLLRAREGGPWPWLCAAGVTIVMGGHSYGFALLLAVLALDRAYGFGLGLKPWAWLPAGAYVAVTLAIGLRGRWDIGGQTLGIWKALRGMEPGLTLRAMPLLRSRAESGGAWPLMEALLVFCAWALAWRKSAGRENRAVLVFYAANFLLFLFYKYDGQYYLPMFALLPAVLAMGLEAAWSRGLVWGLTLTLAAAGLEARAAAAKSSVLAQWGADRSSQLQAVSSELAAIKVLDGLGVGEGEFYRRVWFAPLSETRRLDYLHRLFSRAAESRPREDRCLRIEWAKDSARGSPEASMPAGDYRVDSYRLREGSHCESNLTPFADGEILYWDLRAGGLREL